MRSLKNTTRKLGSKPVWLVVLIMAASAMALMALDGMFVNAVGDVGIGTATPMSTLHVRDDDGTARILVQEASATKAGRILYEMRNNGGPQAQFEDTSNGKKWNFGMKPNKNFFISLGGSGVGEAEVTTGGDLIVHRNIFSGGGNTCDPGPCDATFTDYDLETIEDHAEYMWSNSHLWGVGPTPDGEPFNLSKKTTGILHELEKAHIYIEQLNKGLKAKDDELQELNKRLERLEASLESH